MHTTGAGQADSFIFMSLELGALFALGIGIGIGIGISAGVSAEIEKEVE